MTRRRSQKYSTLAAAVLMAVLSGTLVAMADQGETTRVSVHSGGSQGNGSSFPPAVSADGRYVVFDSAASNLVAGDTNGVQDVFVHDRNTGETTS